MENEIFREKELGKKICNFECPISGERYSIYKDRTNVSVVEDKTKQIIEGYKIR